MKGIILIILCFIGLIVRTRCNIALTSFRFGRTFNETNPISRLYTTINIIIRINIIRTKVNKHQRNID